MRRVLLISFPFHSYPEAICSTLVEDGVDCRFIQVERPPFLSRLMLALNMKEYDNPIAASNVRSCLQSFCPNQIIVINAQSVTKSIADTISNYSHCDKRLYLWDSARDSPRLSSVTNIFDKVFTFDPFDADLYGYKYRPLFYTKTASRDEGVPGCSFVGISHSCRHEVLMNLAAQLDSAGYPYEFYEMLRGKSQFIFHRFIKKDIGKSSIGEFRYRCLPAKETYEIMCRYSTVIDIEKRDQAGLTMRSIESIGARRKLITTNSHVVDYDFYRYGNVCVINRDNPVLDLDFLRQPFYELPDEIYSRYSIKQFARDLIE